MKPFSIRESLASGWKLTKMHFGLVTVAALATGILASGLASTGAFHIGFTTGASLQSAAFASVLSIPLTILCATIVQFAYVSLYLRLADGAQLRFAELFPDFRTYWNYFATVFLVGLITIVGLIVFIIPGIYFALRLNFASLLVIDEGLGPIEAIKKSSILTRGVKWKLLRFWLAIIGLSILAIIPFFLGFLVTIPIAYFSWIRIYRKLLIDTGSEPAFEVPLGSLDPSGPSPKSEVITA
jgi:uncharacterized membrane protein